MKNLDSQLMIISACPGAGGYRMSRILSCFENVYWYDHKNNGHTPWEFSQNGICKEQKFSKYHYDRILYNNQTIPLIGERIAKYWVDEKWLDNWHNLMQNINLSDNFIYPIVVHDTPKQLRNWFPNSTIINLYDTNITATVDRHYKTSANYRVNFELKTQKPIYENNYQKDINYLIDVLPNPTVADLWLYQNYKTITWTDERKTNYRFSELNKIVLSHYKKIKEKKFADYNLCWKNLNLSQINNFGILDHNYEKLLSS